MTSTGSVTVASEFAFRAGESFPSYDQFRARLEAHTSHDLVHYWRRDSRTIEGASFKTSCPIRPDLRYYSVRYACIFGGQKFATKATGVKKVRTSLRNNCPAFVALRATKCGQLLQVVDVCNVHNHEVTAESAQNLAHSKKLSSEERQKVLELLFYGVDRRLIKQYVHTKTGKELSSKDICNMAASLKKRVEFQDMLEDPERTAALTRELGQVVKHGGESCSKLEELGEDSEVDEMLEERLLDDVVDGYENYKTEMGSVESVEEELVQESLEDLRQDVEKCPTPVTNASRNRPRWKFNQCFACGSNNRIVQAQLEVLRARRDKLREETRILRLKRRKLQLEVDVLNKTIKT